jgi:hypothetical protein
MMKLAMTERPSSACQRRSRYHGLTSFSKMRVKSKTFFLNNEKSLLTFQNASGGKLIPSFSWPNTTLYVTSRGVTLCYSYTPCAFSLKIIDPLLRTACTESHPLLRTATKYSHPLLQSKVPTFADIQKCFRDRRAIGQYWILERCTTRSGYRGWAGRTLEPRTHSLYIKNFQKSNTGGLLRERACFGGLFVPARTRFLRQKMPPKQQKLERTWGNTDYRVTPLGITFTTSGQIYHLGLHRHTKECVGVQRRCFVESNSQTSLISMIIWLWINTMK